MMPVAQLSRLVASKALRTVPYPLLGENTLCIADSMVLAPDQDGRLALMFRCDPCMTSITAPLTDSMVLAPDQDGRLALNLSCNPRMTDMTPCCWRRSSTHAGSDPQLRPTHRCAIAPSLMWLLRAALPDAWPKSDFWRLQADV